MEADTPKEIPDVRRILTRTDVTTEYQETATPGKGTIIYDKGYVTKNHQGEIRMADWLHKTFGGEIKLLAESKAQGGKTPDFL